MATLNKTELTQYKSPQYTDNKTIYNLRRKE